MPQHYPAKGMCDGPNLRILAGNRPDVGGNAGRQILLSADTPGLSNLEATTAICQMSQEIKKHKLTGWACVRHVQEQK